jgi:hypothetical protein
MGLNLPSFIRRCLDSLCHDAKHRLRRWTKPDNQAFALNAVLDLMRSKLELVLENALLRQQLIQVGAGGPAAGDQVQEAALGRKQIYLSPLSKRSTRAFMRWRGWP